MYHKVYCNTVNSIDLFISSDMVDSTLPSSVISAPQMVSKLISSWTSLPQLWSLLNHPCIETKEGETITPFHLLSSSLMVAMKDKVNINEDEGGKGIFYSGDDLIGKEGFL